MDKTDLNVIIQAAKAGGAITKKYFGKDLAITEKSSPADMRTRADVESEAAILAILQKHFPRYSIHSEEAGFIDNHSEYLFAIDPLDGSNNFVLGIPYFSISIGLLKGTQAICGVVYNPITDQLYYATKGDGTFLNGERIYVNKESDIIRASVVTIFTYIGHIPKLDYKRRSGIYIDSFLSPISWCAVYIQILMKKSYPFKRGFFAKGKANFE